MICYSISCDATLLAHIRSIAICLVLYI